MYIDLLCCSMTCITNTSLHSVFVWYTDRVLLKKYYIYLMVFMFGYSDPNTWDETWEKCKKAGAAKRGFLAFRKSSKYTSQVFRSDYPNTQNH